MRTAIASVLVAGLLVVLGGLALLYSGLYDVSATAPHWAVTRWVLETARMRWIQAHAAGIDAPAVLDDGEKILTGVAHFAAHCAVCDFREPVSSDHAPPWVRAIPCSAVAQQRHKINPE